MYIHNRPYKPTTNNRLQFSVTVFLCKLESKKRVLENLKYLAGKRSARSAYTPKIATYGIGLDGCTVGYRITIPIKRVHFSSDRSCR